MSERFLLSLIRAASVVGVLSGACVLILAPARVAAQVSGPAAKSSWARDFNGVWAANTLQGTLLPGEEVSLTKFGAEQYNKIDEADSPAYRCEPHGPTRMMMSAYSFMIFQEGNVIGLTSEHINDGYRIIYMNGKHPDDILDYPEWNGNSVGRWEGDTLVVDTIGMREESWLNSQGLQHSAKMHIVERFTKTGPDTFILKVTIDDPVYFTKPFTYGINVERSDGRMMSERCDDTPLDQNYTLTHGKAGPTQNPPPTFPSEVARTYIGADKETRQAKPVVKKTKFEEDTVKTSGGDLKITSIAGYSLMFTYQGKVIDVDPVGRAADYSRLPPADVILVTHVGPEHVDPTTVKLLSTAKTALMVCPHCSLFFPTGSIMINGDTETVAGLKIEAVPAYNIVGRIGDGKLSTSKGVANGYVITFGDKRVYVASETENVPEVKALRQIDVAFLPVNNTGTTNECLVCGVALLKTMTPAMFADTVKTMRPKIVFPYSYGNNDPQALMALLKGDQGIDVRVRGLN